MRTKNARYSAFVTPILIVSTVLQACSPQSVPRSIGSAIPNPTSESGSGGSARDSVGFPKAPSDVRELTPAEGRIAALVSFSRQPGVPLELRSTVTGEVRRLHDAESFSGALLLQDPAKKSGSTESAMAGVRYSYDELKKQHEMNTKILGANNELVKGALKVGEVFSVGAGPGAMIVLGGINYAADKGLDAVLKAYVDEAEVAADKFARQKLASLAPDAYAEWDALRNLPPEQARERAAQMVHGWSEAFVADERDPTKRAAKHAAMNGFVAGAAVAQLAKDTAEGAARDRDQDFSIAEQGRSLKAVSSALVDFTDTMSTNLGELVKMQEDINGKMAEMARNAAEDRIDIRQAARSAAFLEAFAFGRMTTDEQLRALRGGMVAQMTPAEREKRVKELELLNSRKEFEGKVADSLNGTQILLQLGSIAGVNAKAVAKAQRAVSGAQAGMKVLFAYMNGTGYLAAASAVVGFLGGGGPDVGAERHKQVMDKLNALAKGQEVLANGVDFLIKGQATIIENQKKIFESLSHLSKQIQETYESTHERLGEIQKDIIYNRGLIRANLLRDLWKCESFLSSRASYGPRSILSVRNHFSEYRHEFMQCEQGVVEALTSPFFAPAALQLKTYEQEGGEHGRLVSNGYLPLLEYSRSQQALESVGWSEVELLAALSIPSATTTHLRTKTDWVKSKRILAGEFASGLMNSLIAPHAVAQYVDWALQLIPYFDLLERTEGRFPRLRTLEELLVSPPTVSNLKGRIILDSAMKWVNLAIAQQAVLSGEGALAALYKDIEKRWEHSPECAKDKIHPLCLLEANPALARNFMVYAFREELAATKTNITAYAFAHSMKNDDYMLRKVTHKRWRFVWSAEIGWSAKLGRLTLALPNPTELFEGRVEPSPEMATLLQARSKLADALAAADLQRVISPKEQEALGWGLLFAN
ncbi:MAG: hypothetical protein ACK5QT_05630 [Oligoflexia bacterium]